MSSRAEMIMVLGVFAGIELGAVFVGVLSLRHLNPSTPTALRLALLQLWPPRATLTDAGWRMRGRALTIQAIALVWLIGGVFWLARGRP